MCMWRFVVVLLVVLGCSKVEKPAGRSAPGGSGTRGAGQVERAADPVLKKRPAAWVAAEGVEETGEGVKTYWPGWVGPLAGLIGLVAGILALRDRWRHRRPKLKLFAQMKVHISK